MRLSRANGRISVGRLMSAAGRCPACGRYTGPCSACSYCGCDLPGMELRIWLRAALLVLAVAGIAALTYAARQPEPRSVGIAELTPLHNYALVLVEGRVTRNPYVSRDAGRAGYCSFLVNDGGGTARVVAYDRVAHELDQEKLIPPRGAWVRIRGTVRLTGGRNPTLTILHPGAVELLAGVDMQ